MRTARLFGFMVVIMLVGCARTPATTTAPVQAAGKTLTVFAAASTTDVLREAGRRYEAATGTKVTFSFDSSSNLAKQINAGAPADVFISADQKWMDDIAAAKAVQTETREDLLGNELVLIAPAAPGEGFEVKMTKDFDFAAALPQIKRIAVGDPSHVPAGMYARQSLESLGWWKALEPLLIPAQDVRAALRLVEMGEADAGIVYATDAKAPGQASKVIVVAMFPTDSHEPIRYPIALCKDAKPGAADFLRFLRSVEIEQVFQQAGFQVLPQAASRAGGGGAGR